MAWREPSLVERRFRGGIFEHPGVEGEACSCGGGQRPKGLLVVFLCSHRLYRKAVEDPLLRHVCNI